ncbi:ATP-binding cassette domain-containing protein [Xylophilus rhododendri]|uniref:ATP-binding cassette domain-containing protein n=1 Tax=Xylophilus rhododendri TaxID=2697032 RepID=A0A857J904_9BURK|nr:ABC transporter ATP-binding protein [Xylophilus rhododendri]QHI99482.1 ATP-binding cassette domain-containing protein [Xylophilus rhododendri]
MKHLSVKDISLAYGDFQVLQGVSFEATLGGIHGMIGPNGAGKSTLFSVLSGLMQADGGEVRFGDTGFGSLGADKRAQMGLGRTFQIPREFKHLTVRDNLLVGPRKQPGESLLSLFLSPGKVRRFEQEACERADSLIDFLKLAPVAGKLAGGLSGGQKKLLELGRALMSEPSFILLDEPYAGVNPVLIDEISERIREINRERGIGFLIIEHNLMALNRLVEDLYVLDSGRLIAHGEPAAVLEHPQVRAAYMGAAA